MQRNIQICAMLARGLFCTMLTMSASLAQSAAMGEEGFSKWPRLVNPFESTSGGGVMIDGYKPIVENNRCKTDFTVIIPGANGGTFFNEVEFDAAPVAGGTLCHNGRWRAKDGSNQGTTPFRLFLKDGVVYRPPSE